MYAFEDFFFKHAAQAFFKASAEEMPALRAEFVNTLFPAFVTTLSKSLEKIGTKYLCGDEPCIYDYCVGGLFTNCILNPNNPLADKWPAAYAAAPQNVKTYVANFQEDMKDYLPSRYQEGSL